ncbi:MAG: 2-C-methyl-D-erythritol 2,4-cyclodiphosphate synthase [Gammaproteobacteria bacterium]|nr:2-C-methyl-D-erythritol 2,4-cyclodiphosphate synthase [Gammaproteobacteria bacterium]
MNKSALFRIGHGFDVHAFEPGDHIIMAGVRIPYQQQFKAHSDGDVVLHAVCDALLGAAALGDIGQHFPDTDPQYHNIDSRQLLRHVIALLAQQGFVLGNLDVSIVAQAPKMSAHIMPMRKNLAEDFSVATEQINVKATTTEKLGYTGREEGISVHAVVLIQQSESD